MKQIPNSVAIPTPGKWVKEGKEPFVDRIVSEQSSVVLKKEAVSLPIQSRMSRKMAWTSEKKDIVGRWSWGQLRFWGKSLWKKELHPFLKGYETKRWSDIEREKAGKDHRFKSYDTYSIADEAQKRLLDIGLDDMDRICRFRLGNKPRIYGFLCQHVFFVLWWDPDHNICPSRIQDRGKVRQRQR